LCVCDLNHREKSTRQTHEKSKKVFTNEE